MNPPDLPWTASPFRPAWWAPSAHLQTLAGKVLRSGALPFPLETTTLETPDGDLLRLEVGPEPPTGRPRSPPAADDTAQDTPVALVLHGLEGSARRPYALRAYRALHDRGVRPVGLHFRSCGGVPNRVARFYHSGETDDLGRVLAWLGERFPGRPLGGVGFSLGGNVLLKHLGEAGAGSPLRAAVAISVPFDLLAGARLLEKGPMGRIYTRYFLRSLLAKMEEKAALLDGELDLDAIRRARTLREFDDAATAPLHGFRDAAHYYEESSSAGFLDRIRRPVLVLHARDDPFLPEEALPERAMRENPWIVPVLPDRGGHVGFVEGPVPWRARFWAEEESARFLAAALGDGGPVGRPRRPEGADREEASAVDDRHEGT